MKTTSRKTRSTASPAAAGKATKTGTTPAVETATRTDASVPPNDGAGLFPQKFDLGPIDENEPLPPNIPWGYDVDRITAMVVDPQRLFVYWEVTDAAIAAARAALGRGGPGAWLNIRVYDVTDRLFDGTNAHGTFDHKVERHDRQWFFTIGKPTSSACAEVGLLSDEGYFVKIARSGRVEFPRREPVGGGPVEWLSVRTASGDVGTPHRGGSAPAPAGHAQGAGGGGDGQPTPNAGWEEITPGAWGDWLRFAGFNVAGGERVFERRWQWEEATRTEWTGEVTRTEWTGPLLRSEWESGPFSFPVEAPSRVEVRDDGQLSIRTEGGRVHVMYGPWQVVIRGVGARAERHVLATWEYRRQVELPGGLERSIRAGTALGPGGSELLQGASERMWTGSSELLFRGASELWFLGASELAFRGASETLWQGASELRLRGASERLFAGASERRFAGASERIAGGASERSFAGASERGWAGASERSFTGASERALAGASEHRLAASEPPPQDPSSPYPTPPAGGSRS